MKIYIEIISLPLLKSGEDLYAPASALAARLMDSEDTMELRFHRHHGRVHCYIGVDSMLRVAQIKNIFTECRCGVLPAKNIPDVSAEILLLRKISENIVQVPGSAPVRNAVLGGIFTSRSCCEQLYYTLSQMDDGCGFSVFFRSSDKLKLETTTYLKKNMQTETDIYSCFYLTTKLFQYGICVFANTSEQTELLVDELKFAFSGLREYKVERIQLNGSQIWDRINNVKSPVYVFGIQELLSRCLTSEVEALCNFAGMPQLNGIPVNKDTLFQKQQTDRRHSEKRVIIGEGENRTEQSIPLHMLCQHMFISGAPGSGKGNLIFSIAEQLHQYGIPILLIESAKEEQHHLRKKLKDLKVWRPRGGEFLLNPFSLPLGISMGDYRAALLQILRTCFRADGALEELYRTTLTRCFTKYKYTEESYSDSPDVIPFGLSEFIAEYNMLLLTNGYSAKTQSDMRTAGITRLRTLFDQNPDVFDTVHSVPVSELIAGENLLQLNCLTTIEAKQLFCTLLLISLGTWLRLNGKHSKEPRLVIIMDESHNLLQDVAKNDGESYSFARDFQNLLLEMRSVGVGFIVADQSADNLPRGISGICATKVFLGGSRYSGIENYANVLKADEETLNHLYLLNAGEGVWNTYGMSGGAYFRTQNIIDQYNLQEEYPVANPFVVQNPQFMCQTFSQCSKCTAKNACSLQHKEKSRRMASGIMIRYKTVLTDALRSYQIAKLRGKRSGSDSKTTDLSTKAKDDRLDEENYLQSVFGKIAYYLFQNMPEADGYCSLIQFERQFNREAEIQMDSSCTKFILNGLETIKKSKYPNI